MTAALRKARVSLDSAGPDWRASGCVLLAWLSQLNRHVRLRRALSLERLARLSRDRERQMTLNYGVGDGAC